MQKKIKWSADAIQKLYAALSTGSVLVGSSDTVLGLLALPTEQGFISLNDIKGRTEKPYLLLAGSVEKAIELCSEQYKKDLYDCMIFCWPGPVTMVIPAREDIPWYMKSKDNTIAVRVPDHKGLQQLLAQTSYLFSTSANYAGKSIPLTIEDIEPSIIEKCMYVVDEEKENVSISLLPSTIIDCTNKPCKIIREGAMTYEELKKKCGNLF